MRRSNYPIRDEDFNCGKVLQDKRQKFQNRAARILTGASYDVRSADILDTLCWEILNVRRSRNKSVLMYEILNDHTVSGVAGGPACPAEQE